MITVSVDNPFLVKKQLEFTGFVPNGFWPQFFITPHLIETERGPQTASGLVAFSFDILGTELEFLYTKPDENHPTLYEVKFWSTKNQSIVNGYSTPNLLEKLEKTGVNRVGDGFNFDGISFFAESDTGKADFCYCLATPPDHLCSLELNVRIRRS